MKRILLFFGLGFIIYYLLKHRKKIEEKIMTVGHNIAGSTIEDVLKKHLPAVEGFSAVPIWDFKQWSWGHGTAAGFNKNVKPYGTISREQAMIDAMKVVNDHKNQLDKKLKRPLTNNQWAALLSFSYNAGIGNARNIVDTINNGSPADVVKRMKLYNRAGGSVNQGLKNRREKEAALYLKA